MFYEVTDPVHKTIYISEEEKKLFDHPFVVRLRFIRQLGLKFFIYPGATHDRFSHVLGAMHLAGRIFDTLDNESNVFNRLKPVTKIYLRNILRKAALLHDIGHGPFSHASESLMPKLNTLSLPKSWYIDYEPLRRSEHEDYSVLLIYTLSQPKEKILKIDEAQDISSLIHKSIKPSREFYKRFKSQKEAKYYYEYIRGFISGELDVDRMDYLLHDSYFIGVPYGNYDLEWILRTIGTTFKEGKPILTIKSKGLHAFEDYLLARYHMFLQVYFHHMTTSLEYYIEQAIASKEIKIKIPSSPYAFIKLRDSSVIEAIFDAAENPKNKWSKLLTNRVPPKLIYRRVIKENEKDEGYEKIKNALDKNKIFYFERRAKRSLTNLGEKHGQILVGEKFLDTIRYKPIEDVSALIQKYNQKIDYTYLSVLANDYNKALKVLHKIFK